MRKRKNIHSQTEIVTERKLLSHLPDGALPDTEYQELEVMMQIDDLQYFLVKPIYSILRVRHRIKSFHSSSHVSFESPLEVVFILLAILSGIN